MLQKRIMALLRKIENPTTGNIQVTTARGEIKTMIRVSQDKVIVAFVSGCMYNRHGMRHSETGKRAPSTLSIIPSQRRRAH